MYHFYPEFEKDGEFSPSSFVSGIRGRLQNFFQSREKKRAGARVESFHTAKKKDWDQFLNNASRKSFVKQLGSDSRSDAKLVMHADNMNRLQTGKKVGTVQSGSKSYSIVKLRGKDRLGCTCNDWRYKRSVAKPGEVVDCKHIRQFKQMNKTASYGELKKEAAELTTRGRNQISEGNFALPGRRYPIHDRSHARNALARVAQHGTPGEKSQVRKAVAAKYPGIEILAQRELKKEASDKAPRLTFITGGAGAGKSTMAKKLVDSGEFDVLIGTDTGGVVNGQYVKPPKAEREKIRNRREALALKMRAKGKRVLVEGYPRGALRYPKLLAQADDVLYLDTPMATRMFRVGKRSRERGTPMLPDLKMGLTTHFDDLKYRKEIEEKSPNFRSIRTYEDIKKEAMAAREASSKGMQVGDVILTAMAPEQYSKDSGAPLHKRMKEQFFRKASPAAQGSYTHSAIYVGKGQVVEALQGGVVRRSLKRSLRDLDGAVVVRPKVSTKARRAAATFAKTQVGAPYESHKFLAKKGFSIFMPKYFDKKLDHGKEIKKTDKWTCSNLIGAAYALQGHATHTRGGRWSMTAPADFLVSDRNAHVKHLGKALGQRPTIGRLKGKTDLADVSEASAKSRTYKDAKKEAMVLWGLDV
jgi:uncharacterized protein YycO